MKADLTLGRPSRERATRNNPRQRGFTMVETLIALVILAIGLLGIAALYLDSLRAGRTAIYRSQAVTLAADLADRIRANRTAVAAYALDLGEELVDPGACDDPAAPCGAADVAAADLFIWQQQVEAALPTGDAQVVVNAPVDPADPAVYVITIEWSDAGEDAALSYELRVEA